MSDLDPAAVAAEARQTAIWLRRNGDDNAELMGRCADVIEQQAARAKALAEFHASEAQRLDAQVTNWTERALHAETRLHDVSLLKCWTNEDGKRFVFADDLAVALGVMPSTTSTDRGTSHV